MGKKGKKGDARMWRGFSQEKTDFQDGKNIEITLWRWTGEQEMKKVGCDNVDNRGDL